MYDAAGSKLAKKYNGNATQHYAGSIVYRGDGAVDYVLTAEGMARNVNGTLRYQYNLTDHLGSVRAVLNESGAVVQETDYYPFGLAYSADNLQINKYLYNAKELQDELVGGTPLGWLDYHARTQDPLTGRFTTMDPLTEKFFSTSSYAYCLNNPLILVDPDGRDVYIVLYANGSGSSSFKDAAETRKNSIESSKSFNKEKDIVLMYSFDRIDQLNDIISTAVEENKDTYGKLRRLEYGRTLVLLMVPWGIKVFWARMLMDHYKCH